MERDAPPASSVEMLPYWVYSVKYVASPLVVRGGSPDAGGAGASALLDERIDSGGGAVSMRGGAHRHGFSARRRAPAPPRAAKGVRSPPQKDYVSPAASFLLLHTLLLRAHGDDMDVYEATRVVLARIQSLDTENATKIMRYILIQDHGDKEMIRLAFGLEVLLHSVVLKANFASRFASLGVSSPTSYAPPPIFSRSGGANSALNVSLDDLQAPTN
ncbi:hypothetical protein Cni_G20456 [Canna indica]|uniref:AtC3H46-like PABC-like domain-containing protein n=1 Tax=Canna indica TaxID=4628 RepID=A0AAQ3KQ06_9LILI|nr:hypothetical protein Cni_G20456 [Canna indica]